MNGLILFVGMMIPTAIGITIFSLWLFSDNKKADFSQKSAQNSN